jgi:hypothetical protein
MTQITSWLLVVVAALGGFYGGFRYEKAHVPATTSTAAQTSSAGTGGSANSGSGTSANGFAGAGGGLQGAGGGGFGRGAAGKVSDLSGDTLTLTDNQGNPVKVQLSGSTVIEKTAAASSADLVKGATVTVQGQRGSDGAVSATTIVITSAAAR